MNFFLSSFQGSHIYSGHRNSQHGGDLFQQGKHLVSVYLLGYDPVLYRNYLAALKPKPETLQHCDAAKHIILSRVVAMRHLS